MIVLISDVYSVFDKIPFKDKKRIAFIPNAKDNREDKSSLDRCRSFFKERGYVVNDIDLNKIRGNKLYEELSNHEVIFAAGGNCFVLLERMKTSGFVGMINKLLKKGVIYIGQSAGACVTGPSIEPLKFIDDSNVATLDNYEGLKLVDFIFIPHYKNTKYDAAIAKVEKKYQKKFVLKKFTDKEGMIIENGPRGGLVMRKISLG